MPSLSIKDLSDTDLITEWSTWNDKIQSWGAALAVADEFRKSCEKEINKRGIRVIKD